MQIIFIIMTRIAKILCICTAVVNGLDNFQIVFASTLPAEGSTINPREYRDDLCGTSNTGVVIGQVIEVRCAATTNQYRYVLIQSLDTRAEKLCIAEVCVYEGSEYPYLCSIVFLSESYCH